MAFVTAIGAPAGIPVQWACQPENTMTKDSTVKTEAQTRIENQLEQEIYSLMRATGRSRVQVLNAIKVRGPARDDVLRALAK